MASKSQTHPEPQQFDPLKPSIPISYPIKTLEDLLSRSYFDSFHYPFNKSTIPLSSSSSSSSSYDHNNDDGINGDDDGGAKWGLPNRGRILVCHDMAGGYGDDKWVQGGTNANAYAIWHWCIMYMLKKILLVSSNSTAFCCLICASNTLVLGTFLTEWDEGKLVCEKLLSTKEYAQTCAERLTELATALGFDGWLEDNPRLSAKAAGDRKFDVYMGIDVFGRNTYGGGQWDTNIALEVIKKNGVSAAIFAPGWVYETNQPPDFQTAQNR
ncbi:hypothetical protein KSS87_022593 [Heliosperma pusillum]|nr:hypothetical protein KSS87_022593 [Heliosperma pusillum]